MEHDVIPTAFKSSSAAAVHLAVGDLPSTLPSLPSAAVITALDAGQIKLGNSTSVPFRQPAAAPIIPR